MRLIKTIAICATGIFSLGVIGLLGLNAYIDKMPEIKLTPKPQSTMVLGSNGELLHLKRASDGIFRVDVDFSEISPELIKATLFYEDRYFWTHFGVNPISLIRGAYQTLTSRPVGGSTISMQVVRMALNLNTKTISGKIKQCLLAIKLEKTYSKKEILNFYFNLAPYGGNVEGIEAASRIYFHTSASKIRPYQATSLAVTPQNPNTRKPAYTASFDKARLTLGQNIIKENLFSLTNTRLLTTPTKNLTIYSISDLPFKAPHFSQRVEALFSGTVLTTLDTNIQNDLERILSFFVRENSRINIKNGAILVLDNTSHSVVSYIGSANYHNKEISGAIDALTTLRSPASTVKPIIYCEALDEGIIHPKSILLDSEEVFSGWLPANSDGLFLGPITATTALLASRNIPAINLYKKTQRKLFEIFEISGAHPEKNPDYYGLGAAIGGIPIKPIDLASIYSAFANSGIKYEIRSSLTQKSSATPLFSKEASYILLKMLEDRGESINGIPLLYKTGTSNGFKDAWCVGIFGKYTVLTWLGNMDYASNAFVTGSDATRLFKEVAWAISQGNSSTRIEKPKEVLKVKACKSTGDTLNSHCQEKVDTFIIVGKTKQTDSGIIRPIYIDSKTNLRTNRIGDPDVKKVYWEVWPAKYLAAFDAIGVKKPLLPAWEDANLNTGEIKIISPKPNEKFYANRKTQVANINLLAKSQNQSTLYVWVNDIFVGKAKSQPISIKVNVGKNKITVVDDEGNSQTTEIHVLP